LNLNRIERGRGNAPPLFYLITDLP
jgi:hypothetical protein